MFIQKLDRPLHKKYIYTDTMHTFMQRKFIYTDYLCIVQTIYYTKKYDKIREPLLNSKEVMVTPIDTRRV